jgi:peptidyl-prolyl cis-trans isomerase C
VFYALVGCEQFNIFGPKKTTKETAPAFTVQGTVIAKVNNQSLTLEDLNQEIAAYNSLVPTDKPELKISTREGKIKYLKDELVRRALLYQEALNRGLERNNEAMNALEKSKRDILVMELVKQETEKVEASSAEIEEYYNTYKEQLKEPEERQIRETVVATEQEAKDILIQLLQGADFTTLAKERSKSPSSKDGGDLGFISKGKKSLQFDAVAFSDSLEVGKISNIFRGPDGYYILKLEAKRGGKLKSLSEMWDDIKRGLTFLKQQKKIDDLVSKISHDPRFKIEIYEGEIK